MAIIETAQFTTQKGLDAHSPVVFVDIVDASQYWASRSFLPTLEATSNVGWSDGAGAAYADTLQNNGIGGVSQSVSRFGGLAVLGGLTIKYENLDYADLGLEIGQTVTISLSFDDGGLFDIANRMQVYTGEIEDIVLNYGSDTLVIAPSAILKPTIDDDPITYDDYPDAPNSAIGVFKQIVYGNRPWGRGSTTPSKEIFAEKKGLVKCTHVGPDPVTGVDFLIAGHVLKSVGDTWIHDIIEDRFYKLPTALSSFNANGDTLVRLITLPTTAYDYSFADGVDGVGTGWTDPQNAGDRDNDSFASNVGSTAATFTNRGLNLKYDTYVPPDSINDLAVESFARADFTADDESEFTFTIDGVDCKADDGTLYVSKNAAGFIGADIPVVFSKPGSSGANAYDAKVYDTYKQITLDLSGFTTLDEFLARFTFYVACEGHEDDGSGTYTGVANALIESPGAVMHHFAITYGGLITAQISDQLKPAGDYFADRSAWALSFVIDGIVSLVDTYTQFALDTLSMVNTVNSAGQLTAVAAQDKKYTRSNSSVGLAKDRFTDTPTLSSGAYINHVVERYTPVKSTNIKDLKNYITAYYASFYGELLDEETDSDATSISAHGQASDTEDVPSIYDDATIALYLSGVLDLKKEQVRTTGLAGRLDAVDSELGDTDSFLGLANFDGVNKYQIISVLLLIINSVGVVKLRGVER